MPTDEVDLGKLEADLRSAQKLEVLRATEHAIPLKVATNGMREVELVADFKRRLFDNLDEQAKILDEMKAAGNYQVTFQWSVNAKGHHTVGDLKVFKVF